MAAPVLTRDRESQNFPLVRPDASVFSSEIPGAARRAVQGSQERVHRRRGELRRTSARVHLAWQGRADRCRMPDHRTPVPLVPIRRLGARGSGRLRLRGGQRSHRRAGSDRGGRDDPSRCLITKDVPSYTAVRGPLGKVIGPMPKKLVDYERLVKGDFETGTSIENSLRPFRKRWWADREGGRRGPGFQNKADKAWDRPLSFAVYPSVNHTSAYSKAPSTMRWSRGLRIAPPWRQLYTTCLRQYD